MKYLIVCLQLILLFLFLGSFSILALSSDELDLHHISHDFLQHD